MSVDVAVLVTCSMAVHVIVHLDVSIVISGVQFLLVISLAYVVMK